MTAPDESEAWIDPIFDAVVSDAQASGYFDRVNTHEPKSAPGYGLTAAVWVQSIEAVGAISGLQASCARIVFMVRIYTSMLMEPQDMIDPMMLKAVSNLMRRYHDDFDFEGAIRNVDLLGQTGDPLKAEFGYIEVSEKLYRACTLAIPCLVNDVWPQNSGA
jgi:hypothetical protein